MKLFIIGCSSEKHTQECPVIDMYRSTRFKKNIEEAYKQSSECFVFSGKYGLLSLTESLSPYDLNLNAMPKSYKKEMIRRVTSQLSKYTKLSSVKAVYTDTTDSYYDVIRKALEALKFKGNIEIISSRRKND
ncbi:TPA: DUF6884 domain-containing protein [Vibrio vulnificus]